MAEHGLSVEDLGTAKAAPGTKAQKETRKVAAKYRDTATGKEWSGRGLKPRWLQEAINGGKTLQDFAL